MDAQTADTDLHTAYQHVLGREIDEEGLTHYRDRLTQGQQTVRGVVRELAHSPRV